MGGGAWWATVHGVVESRTRLSDFTFPFRFHALEKEMATHSSVLAWRIPGMAEPGGLPSMGSHRVRHDWRNLAAAAAVFHICVLTWCSSPLEQFSANVLSCVVTNHVPNSHHLDLMSAVFLYPYDIGHFHYAGSSWNSGGSQQRYLVDGLSWLFCRFLNQAST